MYIKKLIQNPNSDDDGFSELVQWDGSISSSWEIEDWSEGAVKLIARSHIITEITEWVLAVKTSARMSYLEAHPSDWILKHNKMFSVVPDEEVHQLMEISNDILY